MNHPKTHTGSPACGSTPQICQNLRNLRFPKSAAFAVLLFSVFCSPFSAAAQTPPVFRYQLVTDGVTIWPLDTVASKASVNAATNQVANVEASVADLAGLTETLGSRVTALEATLDDLGEDGVWALEGYVNSIGVLSGTPEYSGEIEILEVTTADNAADPTPAPGPTPSTSPERHAPSMPSSPPSPPPVVSARSSPPRAPPSASATTYPSPAVSPSTASTDAPSPSPPTTAPPSPSSAASWSRKRPWRLTPPRMVNRES